MEEILKLAKEKQIEKIIEYIKNKQTNEERKEIVLQLPDDIKIQLIDRIEDFYIMEKSEQTSGFRTKSRKDLIEQYTYSIMNSLDNEELLDYLKRKNDRVKMEYVIYTKPNDNIKLRLIDMIEDFPYKLLIAHRINDVELQNKIMTEIGVSDILLKMREGTYELDSVETEKYNKSIGIPKELTFGIEIEGANNNYAEILKQIRNLPGDLSFWTWKGDYTISEGNEAENGIKYGLEVVSPILMDKLEILQEIYTVCNMLQELGTTVNSRCGGHIHFGIDYFENSKELWNLIELYGKCEGVFNLINNEPGTLPRDSLNRFAKSTHKKLVETNIDINCFNDISEFIQETKRIQNGKEYDINISDKDTIEFRSPNGSVKPEIWIENIKLFGKLMEVSKGLENNVMPEFDEKRNLFAQIKDEKDESVKCNLLLEMLFDDEKERKIYRERFDKNRSLQFSMEDFREMYIANENNINLIGHDITKEEK